MTQVLVAREKCFGKEATYVFAAFFVTNYGNCFFAGREVLREKDFNGKKADLLGWGDVRRNT